MTILVPLKFQTKLLSQNNNINKHTPVCSLWICSTSCVLERVLRVHAGPLEKGHGEESGNPRGPAGDFLHVPGSYSQRAELCSCTATVPPTVNTGAAASPTHLRSILCNQD